jgi:hypothetical protein
MAAAAAAAAAWRRQWGSAAVAVRQHGSGSLAALQRQLGSGVGSVLALAAVQQQRVGGSMVAAGGVGAVSAAWQRRWQGSGSSVAAAASLAAATAVWWHCGISGDSRAVGAVLPLHTYTVAMKPLVATAMAGAQTTINNQLKAAAATAMEMGATMTTKR